MDFKIVRGKFLSLDKLDALLSANGLSVSALVTGAERSLKDLEVEKTTAMELVDKYTSLASENQEAADNFADLIKKIQSALGAILD